MSTVEDFENALVGATATHRDGCRAAKIYNGERRWITSRGIHLNDKEMALRGYTLDPSAPTTAREALDLAWELAHEAKPWQVIPKGARYLERQDFGLREYTVASDFKIRPECLPLRTVEPLPEPLPDWLDAPAVLANEPGTGKRGVFIPTDKDTGERWAVVFSALSYPWQELTDVTPLYPKGQEA